MAQQSVPNGGQQQMPQQAPNGAQQQMPQQAPNGGQQQMPGYYVQPMPGYYVPQQMMQPPPTTEDGMFLAPQAADTTVNPRYFRGSDVEASHAEFDKLVQELVIKVNSLTSMNGAFSAPPGTFKDTHDSILHILDAYEGWMERAYAGNDPRLKELQEAAIQDVQDLRSMIAENRSYVDSMLGGMKSTMSSLQQQMNALISDGRIAKYAFYNFKHAPREFGYSGKIGLQEASAEYPMMGNMYCMEGQQIWAAINNETHGAVHCVMNLTNDANNQLFVAWKGIYPKSEGSYGASMQVVENGSVLKAVKYWLEYQRVPRSTINEMQRTLADPGVYERQPQVPGGYNAIRSSRPTRSGQSGNASNGRVPLAGFETPSKNGGGRASALESLDLTGNSGAIATKESNAGKANRDNFSIQVRGGSDVSVDVNK